MKIIFTKSKKIQNKKMYIIYNPQIKRIKMIKYPKINILLKKNSIIIMPNNSLKKLTLFMNFHP
jgi:hypothetical protein